MVLCEDSPGGRVRVEQAHTEYLHVCPASSVAPCGCGQGPETWDSVSYTLGSRDSWEHRDLSMECVRHFGASVQAPLRGSRCNLSR